MKAKFFFGVFVAFIVIFVFFLVFSGVVRAQESQVQPGAVTSVKGDVKLAADVRVEVNDPSYVTVKSVVNQAPVSVTYVQTLTVSKQV